MKVAKVAYRLEVILEHDGKEYAGEVTLDQITDAASLDEAAYRVVKFLNESRESLGLSELTEDAVACGRDILAAVK